MTKSPVRIEIVRTPIRTLGSMSTVSAASIRDALSRYYRDVRITNVASAADLAQLAQRHPDLVFLGVECVPDETSLEPNAMIWLTEYCDQQGIACTGSGRQAYELGRNKQLAKASVLAVGLDTAAFYIVDHHARNPSLPPTLRYPLFVKPTNLGGGSGIGEDSLVYTPGELAAKVSAITSGLHADALVEEYLPGREFSVGLLKSVHTNRYTVMPIELIAPPDIRGARILGRRIKSANTERATAVKSGPVRTAVSTLALAAFHALGARDFGRIDIRFDAHGKPHFLEANLTPSLIEGYGSFPKACVLNQGMDYHMMIMHIARLGLARNTDDDYRPTLDDEIVLARRTGKHAQLAVALA